MNWLVSTTFAENYQAVADVAIPNHLGYCRRWGYEYNVHHSPFNNEHVYYNGYLIMVREMLKYYDAALIIDLDLVFMDWTKSLDSLFDNGYDQQIAEENLGPGCSPLNAGMVMLRNENSSYDFLDTLIKGRAVYGKETQVWQKHICDLVAANDPVVQSLKIVPADHMNNYWDKGFKSSYKPGNFCIHFYSCAYDKKVSGIIEYSKKVKK